MGNEFQARLLRNLMGATAVSCVAIATPALAQTRNFDVPAQSASKAISTFARQAGIQLIAPAREVRSKRTNAVKGSYTVEEALRILLQNTGLETRRDGTGIITVRSVGNAPSSIADSGQTLGEENDPAGEEIVVTGTNIRGIEPIGSPIKKIERQEIERSGRTRLQDFLELLPQNFPGSTGEDSAGTDFGASNFTAGQGVDLRGLGASGTLVLVNGRRQASGGTEGAFVDISSIAATAVKRIEILTDGASAIYGSDAIGGVVNFILRDDFNGLETGFNLATFDGHGTEYRASVLAGKTFSRGHILAGYQFLTRNPLMRVDTPYGALNGDMRALGGSDFRSAGGNPGQILNSATFAPAYAIPAGQNGVGLTVGRLLPNQINYQDTTTGVSALPQHEQHSAFVSAAFDVNDWMSVFADGRFARRDSQTDPTDFSLFGLSVPATNPFFVNPFGSGPVTVAFTFDPAEFQLHNDYIRSETYWISAGAKARLGGDWKAELTGSFSQEDSRWTSATVDGATLVSLLANNNPAISLNVFGDGPVNNPASIASMMRDEVRKGSSEVRSVTAVADGPLFRLGAGFTRLAVGADYRREELDAERGILNPSNGVFTRSALSVGGISREVKAAFAELSVLPVIPGSSSIIRSLSFSAAGRYEDYSDFGTTFNPKFGASFEPFEGVRLRGSWGTSFRAPRLKELSLTANPRRISGSINFVDPNSPSGTGRSNVIILTGGNPDLKQETADVWSAGIDVTPASSITFSATYFSVDYKGKILAGASGANVLQLESQWAELITRNPSQAYLSELCQSTFYINPPCPTNVAAVIDRRLRNLAGLRIEGIDFDAGYNFTLGVASGRLGITGTRLTRYSQRVSSTAPEVSNLNTVNNPLKLKIRTFVSGQIGEWNAGFYLNYANSYRDNANARPVDSWTTADVSVGYTPSTGALAGLSLQLSASNLFDQPPPFVNQSIGYDYANASQSGRMLSLSITKAW